MTVNYTKFDAENLEYVVVANAGLGLQACFPGRSLEDCLGMAGESIESGSALKAFDTLMEMNK